MMRAHGAPAAERAGTHQLARLEYGKLCFSGRGAILENAEAGVLAASPGFPPGLRAACTPSAWRLGDDLAGIEAARRFGATVLVAPLMVDDGLVRVGACFRRRPERGEDEPGRQFWRARFVTDGGPHADMVALNAALADPPLLGWTPDEMLGAPAAASPGPSAPSWSGSTLRQWCAHAACAIEHRIPVGLDATVSRAEFFALAVALEAALPESLRPLFSAGWGLAREQALAVALSCCHDFPPDVDVFHPASGRWTSDEGGGPRALADAPSGAGRDEAQTTPRWLRFGDDDVQRCLHTVQRESEAERRVLGVRAWLDGGAPDDRPILDERDGLTSIASLLMEALTDPPRAARSEALLVATLQGPLAPALTAALRTMPRPPVADLVLALIERAPAAALTALHRVPTPLTPWTQHWLPSALDASLVAIPAVAAAHATLLGDATALARHPLYTAWAVPHAGTLALILGSLVPAASRDQAVGVLANLSDAPEVALIHEVLCGDPRSFDDVAATLAALPELRPMLIQLASRRWDAPHSASDRAAALTWLEVLDAVPDHALLRDGPPSPTELDELAHALDGRCVADALLDRLALRALRFAPTSSVFRREITTHAQRWDVVVARWPPPVAALLLPRARPEAQVASLCGPAVDDIVHRIALSSIELDHIGRHAAAAGGFEGRAGLEAATVYLDWCRPRAPARAMRVPTGALTDAVQWLWHGTDPPRRPPHDEDLAALAALLRQVPLDEDQWRARWAEARTSGALFLLIVLHGGPVETPTVPQLERLLECGAQLDALLQRAGWSSRLAPLIVCTRGWQSVGVHTTRECLWQPAYRGTLLSGVFAGLPRVDEAALDRLLDFFARCTSRSRWELGAQYLERRRREIDDEGTAQRIWQAVVEPICREAFVERRQFAALLRYSDGSALLRKPRIEVEGPRFSGPAIVVCGDELRLHPGFAELVRKLGDREANDRRLAAYSAPYETRALPDA